MAEKRTHSEVGPVGRQVAENVRRLRDAQRLTTAGLAERVSARGVPMSPTTVTKIEKKNRRVTVDELAALADALDVAPASLLLARGEDPIAEVAAFAEQMLRGPFHLEIDADAEGVKSWLLGGGRPSRRERERRADHDEIAAQPLRVAADRVREGDARHVRAPVGGRYAV